MFTRHFFIAVIAIAASSFSFAGSFSCHSNVNQVLVYANGAVNVHHSGRGDYTYVCNLSKERQGVSIQVCAMWASVLLDAKKNNTKAQFYFGANTGVSSCDELPVYSGAPAPTYIGPAS